MTDRILNDRYRIIEKIGSGGMADVYKGIDTKLEREVAIKILKQEYSDDPQYLRRLSREAQAMVSIQNEHVVTFYDVGNEDDIHYLVMEYVSGRTLRELMDENGPMKPHDAVELICSVLNALSDAHRIGVVHRDVKPQNILITDDGLVKLTDFGIAKFTGNSTKTFDGKEAMGSVYYISPEQAKGEAVDSKADIYSAGVLLYEMLCGKTPFVGDNAVQVALKHVSEDIVPLREVNNKISPALSDVVAKATAKNKELRYSTADDMAADLHRALRNPYSRFAKIDVKTQKRSEPRHRKKSGKFVNEHLPLIIIIACVVGVLGLFALMFFITTRGDKGDDFVRIPNFIGLTEENAVTFAENRGFKLEIVGYEPSDYPAGEVCSQDPLSQSKAKEGDVISVIISTGSETVSVPNLYGLTVDEARAKLEEVGLAMDPDYTTQLSDEPEGTVIDQSVKPDEVVMPGDVISITVSGDVNSESVNMPSLIGEDVIAALEILNDAGLENYNIIITAVDDSENQHANRSVVEQNPSEGTLVNRLNTVELTVYLSDEVNYVSEFSANLTLTEETNTVVFKIVTDWGEIQINKFKDRKSGPNNFPFTAYFWEKGTFICKIYVNGELYVSVEKIFE